MKTLENTQNYMTHELLKGVKYQRRGRYFVLKKYEFIDKQ